MLAAQDALAQLVMTLVVCPMTEEDRVDIASAYMVVDRLMRAMGRTLDMQGEIVSER